ncbi:MAG: RNA polymerase sigma factor [Bdellovibrionota bacterium]
MNKETALSDLQLVKLVAKGDLKALEELVEKYETRIFNLAFKFMNSEEDAEEVSQDVFLTLYQKAASFKGNSAFSSWLYRITVNAAFMKLRKRRRDLSISINDLSTQNQRDWIERDTSFHACSEFKLANLELVDILKAAILKLPDRYRSVFVLKDIDGLSNQEVSSLLELSMPAVKSRLHRARVMLQKRLNGCFSDYVGTIKEKETALHV